MCRSPLFVDCFLVVILFLFGQPHGLRAGEIDELIPLQKQVFELTAAGRFFEADPIQKQILERAEKAFQNQPEIIATILTAQADLYQKQGRFQEADPLLKRALTINEKVYGPNHLHTANSLEFLARLLRFEGLYADAEPLFKRALEIFERAPDFDRNSDLASCLDGLAVLYNVEGRLAEAEPLYHRSLAIRERGLGPDDPMTASSLNNLALLYFYQGQFFKAERLHKRALSVREKIRGADHPETAESLANLAMLHFAQAKYAEAEPLCRRSLAIFEATQDERHPNIALSLSNLGILCDYQERYGEAESLLRRAYDLRQMTLGPNHPDTAASLVNLANLFKHQNRIADAERSYQLALKAIENAVGDQHPNVAACLINLAGLYHRLDRDVAAKPLVDRAIAILDAVNASALDRFRGYLNRARIQWSLLHKEEAIVDLRQAINLAEQVRYQTSGTEVDRAEQFSQLSEAFEQMVAWQLELGDAAEALQTMERARARSLADEMNRAGISHDIGFSASDLDAFREKESKIKVRLAQIEKKLELAGQQETPVVPPAVEHLRPSPFGPSGRSSATADPSATTNSNPSDNEDAKKIRALFANATSDLFPSPFAKSPLRQPVGQTHDGPSPFDQLIANQGQERETLRRELAQARKELYEHYSEERNRNPAYRTLYAANSKLPQTGQLQRSLLANDGLGLVYLFGKEGGYVIVLGREQVRLLPLSVDADGAKTLGTTEGPLSSKRLQDILVGVNDSGIVPQLAKPPKNAKKEGQIPLTTRLSALWPLLIPETEREAITNGKYKRLIVVPDGPLALFPLETLVVQGEEDPEYLLDIGPPILYGPSLTVLHNLSIQSTIPQGKINPVLTVADPDYDQGPKPSMGNSNPQESGSRFFGVGGRLLRLPFTNEESKAIVAAFTKVGLLTGALLRDKATEAGVRKNVAGRKIVHLACHGLTDQAYGNFFGSLALTPGKEASTNSADDGFLTLPEIYELDMKGCELTILSACETNYGPVQQGEGVWSLSRGFLVSGARRVVASNWLVDDEAGARLISYFCTALAAQEKQTKPADFATQLHVAKKWSRNQSRWKHPYYWSTFVLVGPP